jgi:hypothetical protein
MGRGPVGPGRGHGRGIPERFYILARFYPAWLASDQGHRPPTRTAKPPPPPGIGEARRASPRPDVPGPLAVKSADRRGLVRLADAAARALEWSRRPAGIQ